MLFHFSYTLLPIHFSCKRRVESLLEASSLQSTRFAHIYTINTIYYCIHMCFWESVASAVFASTIAALSDNLDGSIFAISEPFLIFNKVVCYWQDFADFFFWSGVDESDVSEESCSHAADLVGMSYSKLRRLRRRTSGRVGEFIGLLI